jgi:hypothetical protein
MAEESREGGTPSTLPPGTKPIILENKYNTYYWSGILNTPRISLIIRADAKSYRIYKFFKKFF